MLQLFLESIQYLYSIPSSSIPILNISLLAIMCAGLNDLLSGINQNFISKKSEALGAMSSSAQVNAIAHLVKTGCGSTT